MARTSPRLTSPPPGRIGVWLVGACGGVATLTVVGCRAVARGLKPPLGLLTETALFSGVGLPGLSDLVFGGHEVRNTDLPCAAREFSERAGVIDPVLLAVLQEDLRAAGAEIRPGVLVNPSARLAEMAGTGRHLALSTPGAMVEAIQTDLRDFQRRNALADVVVINVSSTEPPLRLPIEIGGLDAFRAMIRRDEAIRPGLSSSVLYAYAALDAGYPYVNFTPSPGSNVPALRALALERELPHMGADGKTGETLVKTALARIFAGRALNVLSWEGHNLLGNRDGYVLSDPEARESKTRSKDRALRQILGEGLGHSAVRIDYVPSLDDWKVAWDFIHFEGFLGTRMSLQFTWQGNDSALAAPLVLDLCRLAAFAHRQGETGLMTWTAAYFKSPAGVDEQDFSHQFSLLEAYAARHRRSATDARRQQPE